MSPERWRRLKTLVAAAAELDPERREAFLVRRAGSDEALLAEARALLARDGEGFLDRPVTEALARAAPELGALVPGARVGPFIVERLHAVGGLSAVYEARQVSPERRVALKVLLAGGRREELLRRFAVEKELLGRLSHPGIAEVYGAATDAEARGGAPWIAMEWIEGERPLVLHASEEGLDCSARLELFLAACDAVQHGHLRGVVHRDLKPDNLLVDASGRVKVIDFGIARVLDASAPSPTRHGDLVGTLPYMSPEQLAGDPDAVDTRSDVYTLGVVLYELLCGARPVPLDDLPLVEALRAATERAPRRPRAVDPSIAPDLEAVVLKALAADPARRYTNAGELARDLRRYRAHEPVEARAPGALHGARLFLRRHRLAVGAGAVVLASLAVATGSFVARTIETARIERVEREKAERVTAFLSSLLTLAAPQYVEVAGPRVRLLLDQASERLESDLAVSPEARADLHMTLGSVYLELGDYGRAKAHLDHAFVQQCDVHGPRAPYAACALDMKGEALIREGRPDEALPVLDEAYRRYVEDPDQPPFMRALAANKRAKALRLLGRLEEAEVSAREAVAVLRGAFGESSPTTASAARTLGAVLADRGDLEDAEAELRGALAVFLGRGGDEDLEAARTRLVLAALLLRAGREGEARECVSAAAPVLEHALPAGHGDLARLAALRSRCSG